MSTHRNKAGDIPLLVKAFAFAADKHRNHRREDRHASPYINHPADLAHELSAVAKIDDTAVLVAAILHDTLEYTDTTADELRTEFGDTIASAVVEITDDKALPEAEQKRLRILRAPKLSDAAKLIKLADLICNVRDVLNSPHPEWTWQECLEYIEWGKQVADGLRGVSHVLERKFDALYALRKYRER